MKNHIRAKAFLVGASFGKIDLSELKEHLNELELLAQTAEYDIIEIFTQQISKVNPSFYIGSGKANSIINKAKTLGVKLIIFDNELTPAQSKNYNKIAKDIKVIDRGSLILDIFMSHAKTKESKVQVELAQLQYTLPRLTRAWTHLERQMGGIGSRAGAGETQIEVDRRLVRSRINKLKTELFKINKNRKSQSKKRIDSFKVALVGYTNAGKSTTMKALSGVDVLIKDQLFATLDTTVRSVLLDKDHKILLSDTVGFIRKLPHHLIASFKSTLKEVVESNLILLVLDASSNQIDDHYRIIRDALESIGAGQNKFIIVLNKVDRLDNQSDFKVLTKKFPDSIFISAMNSIRVDELRLKIIEEMEKNYDVVDLELPYNNGKKISLLQKLATVINREYRDNSIKLRVKASKDKIGQILKLIEN